MANEPENNINTFLENISSLITEACRRMFCDNINVIEYMQRRIESNFQVLNILYDRCQGGLYDRQQQNNIGILV
jgi:flagellar biosynthesis/type III secretory pathway chaperone